MEEEEEEEEKGEGGGGGGEGAAVTATAAYSLWKVVVLHEIVFANYLIRVFLP